MSTGPLLLLVVLALLALGPRQGGAAPSATPATVPPAGERAMLGGSPGRNMVSPAKNLPIAWNVDEHQNVRWMAALGSQTYAGPVVAGGKVFVGTNNEHPRDAQARGDRGVLMAFAAADGAFLWQSAHPKLEAGRTQDWPQEGLCSTPAVEGDRLYYLTNHAEMVALDLAGARVWTLDLVRQLGVVPHYMTASSPLVAGDLVFAVTGNGPDTTGKVPAPAAPSFVAVERATGKLRWSDASPGDRLLDGQWGSPAYGLLDGRQQVIFPGGDGWLYGFDPLTGQRLWRFDANQPPVAGGERSHESLVATPVIHEGRVYLSLGHDPQRPAAPGRLWALEVVGGQPKPLWSLGGNDYGTSLSTVAIGEGVLYAADFAGRVYAVDPASGKTLWKYDAFSDIWASPLLADHKLYVGTEDGDLLIFAAGREMKLLAKASCGSAIYTTPAAADGVLYVATRDHLLALAATPPVKPAAGGRSGSPAPRGR